MHRKLMPITRSGEGWYRDDRRYRVFQKIMAQAGTSLGYFEPRYSPNGHVISDRTGAEIINFSGYDYLSLIRHPDVRHAARDAVERFGSSAGASRLVSGETPLHKALESRIARFVGVESALSFVSGHGTNVTIIGFLFGKGDLILHDACIHNSVLEGIRLSGAERWSFAHNDVQDLERKLASAGRFKNVLVVVEGVYSMDGDVPDLAGIVDLRTRHDFVLMVDEAHALGTVGRTGHGIAEHCRVSPQQVDLWIGTLSKTLVSCGGYVAGRRDLIDFLKYNCPGFVFSTGLPPVNAAAALAALTILERSPERVLELQDKAAYFQRQARLANLNIGTAGSTPVFPVYLPQDAAIAAGGALRAQGINTFPIIYPAVPKHAARVRFFINRDHRYEQLDRAIGVLSDFITCHATPAAGYAV
ncbi:aminotransferase class I/II-fold pyridoxal phosphate-dependent enzyme [Paraburkholderia solisilvae]|uniref:2-amino-3-ketobutyrate coenzyme A ligase n=1 Tax=Paraburkholderia solisilvae TaxID=624376 RepID=A0A6J5DXF6_9BURK|nr:aminotransferase class I/II-fold pyridoxal phosphate-dependent enzyme [Paraburkholderia solisilvae]CAB3758297.1 2-amino-3-ketobutyrate coenzyme A ligase [Paraburkholderia solisilvae]